MTPSELTQLRSGRPLPGSTLRWAERLCERAEREQWDVNRDVGWDALAIERFPAFIRRAMAPIYTRIQLGEVLTLELVNRLHQRLPECWAREFVLTQVVDEARHAEFFSRVVARLGGPVTVTGAMREFFDELESFEDPRELLLGSQIVLEGFAKCVFEEASTLGRAAANSRIRLPGNVAPEQLLTAISDRVGKDESRHVAFGVLYLRQAWQGIEPHRRTRLQELGERLGATLERAVGEMTLDLRHVGIGHESLLLRIRQSRATQFRKIGFDA